MAGSAKCDQNDRAEPTPPISLCLHRVLTGNVTSIAFAGRIGGCGGGEQIGARKPLIAVYGERAAPRTPRFIATLLAPMEVLSEAFGSCYSDDPSCGRNGNRS